MVPKLDYLMGRMIQVEIIECSKHSMKGRVIEESLNKYPKRVQVKKGEVTGFIKSGVNNNAKNENGCCGNDSSIKENSCGTGCCSNAAEFDDKIIDLKAVKFDRLRDYAIASLIATGVILISKITLRYLNSK